MINRDSLDVPTSKKTVAKKFMTFKMFSNRFFCFVRTCKVKLNAEEKIAWTKNVGFLNRYKLE